MPPKTAAQGKAPRGIGQEKKERILLWQDPEEDQEAAALAAEALAEEALAEAALAEAASAADITAALADITTVIITDTIIITARDFSSSDRDIITTADITAAAVLARFSARS